MGEVDVTKLKICSGLHNSFMEQYCLFGFKNFPLAQYRIVEILSSDDSCTWATNKSYNLLTFDVLKEKSDFVVETNCNNENKGLIKDFKDKLYILFFTNSDHPSVIGQVSFKLLPAIILSTTMDGYALSLFTHCLSMSQKYVDVVTNYMSQMWSLISKQSNTVTNTVFSKLQIKLIPPEKHVMDLIWAKMACTTIHELRQLQYAMSWLSTLGGAFSALGEEQERFAKVAGKISIEQLRIALKLGDNIVITQCKLYFSLSLIQQGRCRLAKKLILEQYYIIKNNPVFDKRTMNMCKGIWARLKYEMHKHNRTNGVVKMSKPHLRIITDSEISSIN